MRDGNGCLVVAAHTPRCGFPTADRVELGQRALAEGATRGAAELSGP